jgi:Flp pilus assembly secretin CpaC/beta-lactamase regulating signal transducer with metallopeptidase domain
MNAVLWWIGQNTVVAALMIPAVLLLCRLFCSRPAVQHLLWLVLLVKLVLPPFVESPWLAGYFDAVVGQAAGLPPDSGKLAACPATVRFAAEDDMAPPTVEMFAAAQRTGDVSQVAAKVDHTGLSLSEVTQAIFLCWCVGSAGACLIQLRRIVGRRSLIRGGAAAPRHLDAEIGSVSKQLGVRPIRAVVVRRIASPFVWCFGWLRLIWPEGLLSEKDMIRARGIIAHELAHIRRRDHWVAWLELAAGLLLWWNPVFWFVRRRLREAAELACDAVALGALPDERAAYAEMFLELSSSFESGTPAPVLGMSAGAPSSFERRLTMILSDRVSGKMSWTGFVLAGLLALMVAPSWSLGQPAAPPLTDFEKRLLQELREREAEIERSKVRANASEANGDAAAPLSQTPRIINMLRVPGEQQIMLKVIVAEVNREAARKAGINFTLLKKIPYLAKLTPSRGNVPVLLDNGQLLSKIDDLKSQNFARVLAAPKLVTLDGMPANFQAGGEIPVPVIGAFAIDPQEVTMVPYGLSLNFTPHITDNDRIRLKVNVVNSTRDSAAGKEGDAADPGLTSRTFSTTVELRERQTIAIAGQGRADAPDTELVVLITPELVHSIEYQEVPPLPGAQSKDWNDARDIGNSLVQERLDPQNKVERVLHSPLDLIVGRVRPISLKDAPKRIQVGDGAVAVYNLVSPKEITLLGRTAGSTMIKMWFTDDQGRENVKSYVVRVFTDPDAKERLDRAFGSLAVKVNRTFPKSNVRLLPVGDTIVVVGQAHDAVDATQIIRLIRADASALEPSTGVMQPLKKIEPMPVPTGAGMAKSSATDVRVIQLTNVKAKDIAKVLVELFAREGNLAIVAEPSTNSLLVRGTAEQQQIIEALVSRLEDAARSHQATPPGGASEKTGPNAAPATKTSSKELLIQKKLSEPITLNFTELPLYRVVNDLQVISGLNLVIDNAALKKAAIPLEQPLSLTVNDMTMRSALSLLLRQAKLTYVVGNESVVITPAGATSN